VSAHPPASVVIGIDVGTTAAKVSAFGLGSSWRHTASREYPLLHPKPGWEVQDPDVLTSAVLAALDECVQACRGARVEALALSSAMHGLIGLDEHQRPLTPLVTWADSRAADEATQLRRSEQGQRLHRTSGTPMHSQTPLPKLVWFTQHEPELAGRVRWWIGLKEYVLLRLTGTLATEISCASGTGLLDMSTRTWNPEAIEVAGIRREQLPDVLPTTATLGLSAEVADRLGLPHATPVVVGAGDGPLGNLAVRALRPGIAGLSLGTSGALRMVTEKPGIDADGRLFCYALTDDAWVTGGAVSNGGIVVRWAGDVFGGGLAAEGGGALDEALLGLAADVRPGSDGLVMLPYLLAERAPLWNPDIRGAYLGLRNTHTRGHFVRAAVEGVALQLSAIKAELDAITPVTQVRATGGVFRSPVWRDIIAGVLDVPVVVTAGAEGSGLGAAALGLLGIGRASDLDGALTQLGSIEDAAEEPTVARPEDVEAYRRARASIPVLLDELAEARKLFEG